MASRSASLCDAMQCLRPHDAGRPRRGTSGGSFGCTEASSTVTNAGEPPGQAAASSASDHMNFFRRAAAVHADQKGGFVAPSNSRAGSGGGGRDGSLATSEPTSRTQRASRPVLQPGFEPTHIGRKVKAMTKAATPFWAERAPAESLHGVRRLALRMAKRDFPDARAILRQL
jgi:hypothetical protein